MPHLTNKDGRLYLADDILVFRYPAGDCDCISWPLQKKQYSQLASCLFDAIECGELAACDEVLLPNGKPFSILANLN